MPAHNNDLIHDDWWIARQFKEAELQAKSDQLRKKREAMKTIRSLIAESGLTEEDFREMFS